MTTSTYPRARPGPGTFHTREPGPRLAGFVERLWACDGYVPAHEIERRLPTGTVELVINLREDRIPVYDPEDPSRFESFPGSLVSGPHSRHFVIDTACQAAMVGVHFKPGGARPFSPVPADELRDLHVSLDALWGAGARELRDRVIDQRDEPESCFRILEAWLFRHAGGPSPPNPAVAYALEEFEKVPQPRSVADVAGATGRSNRRFVRQFRDEVGLTPKLLCRIRRFQALLQRAGREPRPDWSRLALACGYYDQSHLIRDFKLFSGLTPTDYVARRSDHQNHIPVG